MPTKPMPKLAETIQHSVYTYMWAPVTLFVGLGCLMKRQNKNHDREEES
jgi:hypothetical protein